MLIANPCTASIKLPRLPVALWSRVGVLGDHDQLFIFSSAVWSGPRNGNGWSVSWSVERALHATTEPERPVSKLRGLLRGPVAGSVEPCPTMQLEL